MKCEMLLHLYLNNYTFQCASPQIHLSSSSLNMKISIDTTVSNRLKPVYPAFHPPQVGKRLP